MAERSYTSRNIADICGIRTSEVSDIRNRGFFNISFSEENPKGVAKYKVVKKTFKVSPSFVNNKREHSGCPSVGQISLINQN